MSRTVLAPRRVATSRLGVSGRLGAALAGRPQAWAVRSAGLLRPDTPVPVASDPVAPGTAEVTW